MINLAEGTVKKLLHQTETMTEVMVSIENLECPAISYHDLTGIPQIGDQVVLNTTAVDLRLGTGGYHFVVYNKSQPAKKAQQPKGHIMKLRYTPFQFSVLSVEEENSPYRKLIENETSLKGMPVVVGLLHSHVAPAALALHWASQGNLKIAYIMTDGGALPIAFSRQVNYLKAYKIIAGTVTAGHAFGGDLEAVNYFSALIAAKQVLKADVAIIAMGPGIVGTNTRFGFSGIEQGQIANAVTALKGRPVIIPRISFADPRERHQGLSHHSQTILKTVALTKGWVGLPVLPREQASILWRQIRQSKLEEKFHFVEKDTSALKEALTKYNIPMTSMGRSYDEDPAFFAAAWASGLVAYDLCDTVQ